MLSVAMCPAMMRVQTDNVRGMVRDIISKVIRKKVVMVENTPEDDNAANELLEKKLLDLLRDDPDHLTIPPCPDELCQELGLRRRARP